MPKTKKQAQATTPATTTPAVQATPAPAPVQAAPSTPAAAPSVSKQQLTIMKLVVAFREKRQIEVKPEQLVQDGKFINVMLGPDWPTIAVGPSGGITVVQLKSYANAFDAALEGDTRLAKQNGREAKAVAAKAIPPAAAAPEAKKAEEKEVKAAA